MKRKNDLAFLGIFILVVGISVVYLFQTSYAKYRRVAKTELEATIAKWNLKVNTQDISTETTLEHTLTPTLVANQYVKDGTIAPGSTGYFDIEIDATNVDVDFTYTIDGVPDTNTPLEDLKFTKYTVNGGSDIEYNPTTKITGNITKNTASTAIRVYFEWDDSATNIMDNKDDTEYTQNDDHRTTKVNVTIDFKQKNS